MKPDLAERRFSPSFERNFQPIRDTLRAILTAQSGVVLEIGSGSGQHVAHLAKAYPHLSWLPSELDPDLVASIRAWIAHLGVQNAEPPVRLDAAGAWAVDPALDRYLPIGTIFSANVIHIAPWAVAEGIVAGAGQVLAPGGTLIFYGPFKEGGHHTGDGNAAFDQSLRGQNPAWGLRDIDDLQTLATGAGLGIAKITAMPSNNRLVVFRK